MTIKHKVNAATPRLSDEDVDPIEKDDNEGVTVEDIAGFIIWSSDDILDIRNLIDNRMNCKEQAVLDAFLEGLTYLDMGVTEKYWRYHFAKGIEFLKRELGV